MLEREQQLNKRRYSGLCGSCVVWFYVFYVCVCVCSVCVCVCVRSVHVWFNQCCRLLHVQSGKTRSKPITEATQHTSVPLLGGPTTTTRCVPVCVHAVCMHAGCLAACYVGKLALSRRTPSCEPVTVPTPGVHAPCTRVCLHSQEHIFTPLPLSLPPPPAGPLVVYQGRTLTSSSPVSRPALRPSPPRTASLPLHSVRQVTVRVKKLTLASGRRPVTRTKRHLLLL